MKEREKHKHILHKSCIQFIIFLSFARITKKKYRTLSFSSCTIAKSYHEQEIRKKKSNNTKIRSLEKSKYD